MAASKPTPETPETDGTVSEPTPEEAAQTSSYLAKVAENYSRYKAEGPLFVDGARAFNAGEAVPADHPMVPQWLADDMVSPVKA